MPSLAVPSQGSSCGVSSVPLLCLAAPGGFLAAPQQEQGQIEQEQIEQEQIPSPEAGSGVSVLAHASTGGCSPLPWD